MEDMDIDDTHLEKDLKRDLEEFLRNRAKKLIAERPSLNLGQVAKLVAHPEQGDVVKEITLGELFNHYLAQRQGDAPGDATVQQEVPAKRRRPGKRKATNGVATAGVSVQDGASEGRSRPRLDYETGCKEVLAALVAAEGPASRSELESATDYNGIHLRAYLKKLIAENKVNVVGNGGRSTRYEAA